MHEDVESRESNMQNRELSITSQQCKQSGRGKKSYIQRDPCHRIYTIRHRMTKFKSTRYPPRYVGQAAT